MCNPNAPGHPYTPISPQCPHTQYIHVVVKSHTTAGQHNMWSACWSDWCFARCTPHCLNVPQGEASHGQDWSAIDCLVCYCCQFAMTIFTSTSSVQYTIFISLKLSQYLQYLPKYSLQSSSCFKTLKTKKVVWTWKDRLIPWRTQSDWSG